MGAALTCGVIVALALLIPEGSRATGPCTITWVGDVDANWTTNNAGNTNWSGDTLPGAADRVCVVQAGAQPVTLAATVSVADFEVSAGAGLELAASARLTAAADSINGGTLRLRGPTTEVRVENGAGAPSGTLTNAAGAELGVTVDGAAGVRLITGNLVNNGSVSLFRVVGSTDDRRLTISGNFTQSASGLTTFNVEGRGFSGLIVGGTAALAGRAQVVSLEAAATGRRRVIAAASRTGTFTSIDFTGPTYTVEYATTGVDLTDGAVPATPVLGAAVVAGPVSGTVRIRRRGSNVFTTLGKDQAIPTGSEVDATRGTVAISTATRRAGAVQSAQFRFGRFIVTQTRSSPLATLSLSGTELRGCPRPRRASASARRRTRRLFGSGKGNFRTRGRYGSATIRGTRWLVQDFCHRTVFKSLEGTVSVRDDVKRRTVTLRAGRSYTARAR